MRSVKPVERTAIASRMAANSVTLARDIGIADVRIGPGYTAAMPAYNRVGVAYTIRKEARNGCSVSHGLRPLSDRAAPELLALLESPDPIGAGAGLVCENAPANRPVVILGASTPLLPRAFSMADVTVPSGIVVKEAKDVLQAVSGGDGMRQFSPYVRKVCLRTVSSKSCQRGKSNGRRR